MLKMTSTLKHLLDSLGGTINFVQTLMFDITKIKQTGNITSKIYDDLVVFIFSMKQDISSQIMNDTFLDIVRLFKNKQITLAVFLQEVLSYCLLFTFGEFWDYSTCLYTNPEKKEINIPLLRGDEKFRNYLQQFYNNILQQIFPAILTEKSSDNLFACFNIINDFSTLPVMPENTRVDLGENATLTMETILLLLPYQAKSVRELFKDELFCFFYSLYKLFVDQLLRDYRSHLGAFAFNVYNQVFEKFDRQQFLSSHPLKIPRASEKQNYQKFMQENHRNTYFRPVKVAKYLLENCMKKLSSHDLQKLTYDCISGALKLLFESAQSIPDSFDSSLFIVKNLLDLYAFLENDFEKSKSVVKLSQVNFNPKNTSLGNLFRGKIDLETLGGILFELMPKMTEYSVDLKSNICKALDHILERNLEIFGMLTSKPLVEYLGRIKPLSSKKASWDQMLLTVDKADSGQVSRVENQIKELQEALDQLFSQETVMQVYNSFDSSVEEIFLMMVDKLNCYADDNTAKVFQEKFLPFLIENTVNLLHSFYVEVAKGCKGDFYKDFNFRDAAKWKENITRLVEERLEKRESTKSSPTLTPKSPQ